MQNQALTITDLKADPETTAEKEVDHHTEPHIQQETLLLTDHQPHTQDTLTTVETDLHQEIDHLLVDSETTTEDSMITHTGIHHSQDTTTITGTMITTPTGETTTIRDQSLMTDHTIKDHIQKTDNKITSQTQTKTQTLKD